MTDKSVPLSVAEQAVRMAELEGGHRLLAAELKSSVGAFRSTLDNVQIEVRNMAGAVRELAELQHGHDQNNRAIEDVKAGVDRLSDRLERWSENFDAENKERWDKHDKERDDYREKQQAENQRMREKMTLWTGIGFTFLLLGGAIVSGFVYVLNMRFKENDDTVQRVERQQEQQHEVSTELLKSVHNIDLYIAEQRGLRNENVDQK